MIKEYLSELSSQCWIIGEWQTILYWNASACLYFDSAYFYFFEMFTLTVNYFPDSRMQDSSKLQPTSIFYGKEIFIFSHRLPGSSFADNYHFTSARYKIQRDSSTISPALVSEILKKTESQLCGGPSKLKSFFHVQLSQSKAKTSLVSFPFTFPPQRIIQEPKKRHWNCALGGGTFPLPYTIDHFLSRIEKTDILSLAGTATDLSALKLIFFLGCSTTSAPTFCQAQSTKELILEAQTKVWELEIWWVGGGKVSYILKFIV